MIRGVTVTVLRPAAGRKDRYGTPTPAEPTREAVENVLVSPAATEDMEASREHGTIAALTLHFPKSYAGDLRGCSVKLPEPWGGTWRVVGDPRPYVDADCPPLLPWHMPVTVEVAHG